ncbi:MAG TPA: N,N-dimethylformamidase beta subunit family domain-containing protein [Acidimicrobiales bacterium]
MPAADHEEASNRLGKSPRKSHRRRARFARRRAGLIGAVVAVAVLVAGIIVATGAGHDVGSGQRGATAARSVDLSSAASEQKSSQSRAARTSLGPDGVESSVVIAENKLPGTNAWRINPRHRKYIEGFASTTDAVRGDQVSLYVSTPARTFEVIAYRMGWYQGKGAREVWRSAPILAKIQPPCPVTSPVNMVSCDNWSPSAIVRITPAFVPGDYLLKLVGSGAQQSYVLLTVSQPSSRAAYLVIARSMTEEGWNTFGGYDFYLGEGPCTFGTTTAAYPTCNRSRIVSFDRPYAESNGAEDFLTEELPLVEFAEQHGLDVTYTTDVAVSEQPSLLLGHRAILSLAHDETWTYAELSGVQTAIGKGENVAFFSAAAIVRHARLQASPLGRSREVVDYRDADEDPLNGKASQNDVTGNTWASSPTDYSVTALVGELYSGFLYPGKAAAFVVTDASSWIFSGTGLRDGSKIPEVIASDIDHLSPSSPMPSDLEVLGHSPVPISVAFTSDGEWDAETYSDMTYYTDPKSEAGVFDSGTVNWITTLDECPATDRACPARLTSKITGNLLHLFGQGPAGRSKPSVANSQLVKPAGS